MATDRPVNWTHFANVVGATVIIGIEAMGAGGATGWAVASLMQLGDPVIVGATIVGAAGGALATAAFFKSAYRVEPFL